MSVIIELQRRNNSINSILAEEATNLLQRLVMKNY